MAAILHGCPWCRFPAVIHDAYPGSIMEGRYWFAACTNEGTRCGARGPFASSPESALRKWNRVARKLPRETGAKP